MRPLNQIKTTVSYCNTVFIEFSYL